MYKNRKFNGNVNVKPANNGNTEKKRRLNTIGEDTTIKLSHGDGTSLNGAVSVHAIGNANVEEMFSSEENIPASQEPTQRYLSQRSIAATLTKTHSRNISQRPPNTYFELALMQAGAQLDEGDNFVLSCDHISFVNKLRELLVRNQNYPENVQTFKSGLRDALSQKSKIALKLLRGCTICPPNAESVYQSQDSMIVNFLMLDILRSHVLEVLLDRIEAIAKESNDRPTSNSQVPLLPLMLAQLRYTVLSNGDYIYARIKRIFEEANEIAKWEIISNAEFTLNASKHDEFAQLLIDKLCDSREFFQTTTIQTLTSLCLGSKMQGKLRCKMLAYIKDEKCDVTLLPALVKFLLKSLNDDNDDSGHELVNTLREILIFKTDITTTESEKKTQLELFEYIEQNLIRSRKFYYIWQKTIASLAGDQFKSIDFIILLLLIHIRENNSLYIENILRRRIKLEHVTVEILNDAKNKYSAILERHMNTLMQILHDFLREKNKIVADFARASYGVLFQICETAQRQILKNLLKLTCDKSALNMTTLSLELLRDLQHKHVNEIQNWAMLLLPLLDRLNDVSLSQTRLIMEILCSIAFPAPTLEECAALQEQIDMLVKKQLISRNPFVRKQGIIGCVQLIDSIARIDNTSSNMDDFHASISSVSALPEGRSRMAATYIIRIESYTMYCAESLALFYDELANACELSPADCTHLYDKCLLVWLCEHLTYNFQNNFVAENAPGKIAGLELSYQKCINSLEDTNTEDQESEVLSVAINISELTLKPPQQATASIYVLAPLFKLVRVLHSLRYEGSLEQINALLGCAIILPSFFNDSNAEAILHNYDEEQQRKILDIYFHCANWMRETVSSFATQRESMIRIKVLQRLADLIQVEGVIRKLLHRAPADYVAPVCQFICAKAASVTGRGKHSGATNVKSSRTNAKTNKLVDNENSTIMNDTNMNSTNAGDTTAKMAAIGKKTLHAVGKTNFEQLYGPREVYRQMDSDIILILHEKLSLTYPLAEEEIGHRLGLLELRFILTDLVWKLESITGVQKFDSEQSLQYIAKPGYFLHDLSKFLNIIIINMEMIGTAINEQLQSVQHTYSHVDLFTDEFGHLKVCYGLCVRLLADFFSWPEFTTGVRETLLKDSLLAVLGPKVTQKMRSKSIAYLAIEVFNQCQKYETATVELKAAVHLFQLLMTLSRFATHASGAEDTETQRNAKLLPQELRSLCKKLLCRKWFNYDGAIEKGVTCNLYLDHLIKGFVKDSDFHRQREILRILLEECKQMNGKDSSLKSFPNIKKQNFPLLFRALCEVLISCLSDCIATNATDYSDELKIWEKSSALLNLLLEILQSLDVPRDFQLFLKYAHIYLKLTLQRGLPIFEKYLRQNPERVNELLKSLQVTTRFLHNLCVHSKALKKIAIVSQIPFLRETVENLLFRVKALLAANKCSNAFWMGCLKNKDLHGDEIISEVASLTTATQSDSDEEIPEDDESIDETILDQNESKSTIGNTTLSRGNRSKSSSRSKCF